MRERERERERERGNSADARSNCEFCYSVVHRLGTLRTEHGTVRPGATLANPPANPCIPKNEPCVHVQRHLHVHALPRASEGQSITHNDVYPVLEETKREAKGSKVKPPQQT